MKRVRIYISGKVQGVFYRRSTWEKARALNLTGWVRNLDNGMVLVEAQGLPNDIEKLVQWCYIGPDGATVTGIETGFVPPQDEEGFRILR